MKNVNAVVRGVAGFGLAILLAAAGKALGAEAAAARDLAALYPGLHTYERDGNNLMFYGVPMNQAATADAAADFWISRFDTAFGAGSLELQRNRTNVTANGRFTIYTLDQTIDGIPVEFGMVKVVVLNRPTDYTVVLASAKVAKTPEGGFPQATMTGERAIAIVQAMAEYRGLPLWGQPEMVVYQGEGDFHNWITPTVVWKFTGEAPDGAMSRKFTFLVDAATGKFIHARNEILHINVTGSVHARATPTPVGNVAADHAGNPPADRTVPNIRVRINGNNATSAYTDENGNFDIPWAGTTPVTLDCSVADGRWVTIQEQNAGQALLTASVSATPGTPARLDLNPGPGGEFANAQINAFIHQNTAHNFIKHYAPTFTALDTVLPARPGTAGTCNAFYNGTSTNFYNVGGGCNNTAFSSVVAHEYGHHIVNRGGLAQGGFGEGFGDTISILIYDDVVVGRYFSTGGGPVRRPDTDGIMYPCIGCAIHTSGEVLGGIICKVRRNLGNKYGSAAGLEIARQLHVDWYQETLGGDGNDSASPRTLSEYLTMNDDDGNLNNGTPDICEISTAFAAHGVRASGATDAIQFVIGALPTMVAPGSSTPVTVTIKPICRNPVAATGRINYRFGTAGPFITATMTQGAPNTYTYDLVGPTCAAGVLQYYFAVNTTNSDGSSAASVNFPASSTNVAQPYSAVVASGTVSLASDDFEADRGWTTGPNTSATGLWTRGNPIGTIAQPENDHSASGVQCFFTGQGTAGGTDGEQDVDAGFVTLTSPAYDLTGGGDATITYWRWYSNGAGAGPFEDTFKVDVSTDNGATWVRGETVGPGASGVLDVLPGWRFASWTLSSVGRTPTAQVKLRFTAEDAGVGSLVEAAIDDLQINRLLCVDPPTCFADFNQDGGIDGQDIEAFFTTWSQGLSAADVNLDGGVDGQDVETFFIAWEAGEC